jgi:ribosomal protein S18
MPIVRPFSKDGWTPDYKDVNTLQKLCSPQGKLYDRKRLGTTAKM